MSRHQPWPWHSRRRRPGWRARWRPPRWRRCSRPTADGGRDWLVPGAGRRRRRAGWCCSAVRRRRQVAAFGAAPRRGAAAPRSSSTSRQAASCPPPRSNSGGSSRGQRSKATGQRGWKRQPGWDARWVGRLADQDHGTPPRRRIRHRHHRAQRAGVRVLRIGQDGAGVADLHDAAQVHDRDPIRVGGHGGQVVRDHQHCDAVLVGQLAQQVQDLGADADVEHAHRLIGHQQARPQCQCRSDDDPLALAARQLERQAVQIGFRRTSCRPG